MVEKVNTTVFDRCQACDVALGVQGDLDNCESVFDAVNFAGGIAAFVQVCRFPVLTYSSLHSVEKIPVLKPTGVQHGLSAFFFNLRQPLVTGCSTGEGLKISHGRFLVERRQ